jgi:tetratricopeptide (TPR) repeat protein
MSAWKLVYRNFFRIVLSGLILANALVLSGCSDPVESANAKGALAQAQLDSGQIVAARKTIAEAIAERDDIPELHMLRARIELQANSPGTAYGAYSTALALDSANLEALIGVAQLGLQLGHVTESEDATIRVLAMQPNQPNALLMQGLHNLIKRRFEEAVANADAMIEVVPDDENAAILKARALALMNRPDEAFAVIGGASGKTGDTLSIALTLLELHRVRNDGAAMVPVLERIRKLSPENASYDVDQADTLYKLGDAPRARGILRQRLLDPKIDEKTATSIANLLKEYDQQPFDGPALGAFAGKASVPARKAVARLYLDRGDPARALAALSGAPAIDDIVALRARARIAEGRVDESLAQANAILDKDRTHCDALIAKGQGLLAKRRFDDAVSAGTQAASLCPQMTAGFLTLVKAHEAAGNEVGAGIAFRDAFDRNGQDSALVKAYTAWLVGQGHGIRALGIARRLTNQAPSLLSAWRLYGDLCTSVPDADCAKDAEAGLGGARLRFVVDPRLDESPPTGLFGRLARE